MAKIWQVVFFNYQFSNSVNFKQASQQLIMVVANKFYLNYFIYLKKTTIMYYYINICYTFFLLFYSDFFSFLF